MSHNTYSLALVPDSLDLTTLLNDMSDNTLFTNKNKGALGYMLPCEDAQNNNIVVVTCKSWSK